MGWFGVFAILVTVIGGQECNWGANTYRGPAFSSTLPVFIIQSKQAIPPAQGAWAPALLQVANNGMNAMEGPFLEYDGPIEIHRRGQSSDRLFCKKQYSIKFVDEVGDKVKHPLLGLPKTDHFILYGPYADKTLARNVVTFNISNEMGLYSSGTRFVEMYLLEDDSEVTSQHYNGVYVVLERIDRRSTGMKKVYDDDLSGGYVVKKDKGTSEDANFLTSTANLKLTMVYPDVEDVTPAQFNWIGSYISCFEEALFGPSFASPEEGYAAFVDVESFIDYFLLQEWCNNPDAYKYSTYMTKQRYGKLAMGPPWDFNLAFGNIAAWLDTEAAGSTGWKYEFNSRLGVPDTSAWYARMLMDPTFKTAVVTRWTSLRAGVMSDASLEALVESITAEVDDAQWRNYLKWSSPGIGEFIWPEPMPQPDTFSGHMQILKDFLRTRCAWMDAAIVGVMYTKSEPTGAMCCDDPNFAKCYSPKGALCNIGGGDVSAGLGKYFDFQCATGAGAAGCSGELTDSTGGCRFCRSANWNGMAGNSAWPECSTEFLCANRASCQPFNNDPDGHTRSPTTAKPTSKPASPTPQPTTKPTAKPSSAGTPTAATPGTEPTPAEGSPTPAAPGTLTCTVHFLWKIERIKSLWDEDFNFDSTLVGELSVALHVTPDRLQVLVEGSMSVSLVLKDGATGPATAEGLFQALLALAHNSTGPLYQGDITQYLDPVTLPSRGTFVEPTASPAEPSINERSNVWLYILGAVFVSGAIVLLMCLRCRYNRKKQQMRDSLLGDTAGYHNLVEDGYNGGLGLN